MPFVKEVSNLFFYIVVARATLANSMVFLSFLSLFSLSRSRSDSSRYDIFLPGNAVVVPFCSVGNWLQSSHLLFSALL